MDVRPGLRTMLLRRLGLGPDATPEETRSAYRSLAKAHHPDHGGDADKFQAVHAAYRTLQDAGWV